MTTHAISISAQIAQLPNLPMENLWAMWDEFFDRRPPSPATSANNTKLSKLAGSIP